ncbi:MAG: 4-alpha-glucanotransferase [Tannerella sp.]|jgi:4-alpha-glucanotransferase|nr:4-alpha-glucanotransferase [Tannerella sp.]
MSRTITFRLFAPSIREGQTVCIAGNQLCLGNWDPAKAIALSANLYPQWKASIDADAVTFPLEYKFIVRDSASGCLCYWEEGDNRRLEGLSERDTVIIDYPLRTPAIAHNAALWKACGVVIPVFSLRSEYSFGFGDLGDLRLLIDWAALTGQRLIQILPINDTTRTHTSADSYPYSAISIYALHPLFINIPAMGALKDRKRAARYEKLRRELNACETVDYKSVEQYKTEYYREFYAQEKENILNDSAFNNFIADNQDWLIPYAAFAFLRDNNGGANFRRWGEYADYRREKIEQFCKPGHPAYEELRYIFFVQYTLHKQFREVSDYARRRRIILKGDIPIGVNRDSVEAWTEPDCFNMQGQSGAPPDDFSDTGQNWSFPTYNWDVMERDGFLWWKRRFAKLADYFDSFRIDHILGFFRIWEIPRDYVEGLCGHFRPSLPLSVDEIERYGLPFDRLRLRPRVHVKYLKEFFGDEANNLEEYMDADGVEHLALNELHSTQRKLKKILPEGALRDGLMRVANEVLFLEDPYQTGHYHPRISAYKSYVYTELKDSERQAFDRLYHDYYFVRHNDFWKATALRRLTPLINSAEMLVCGEDLGMIPDSVHEVMQKLQILSLELERAPKTFGLEFADLKQLPYYSVCTTSTHDMSPLRAWWTEDRDRTQRYYNNVLHLSGEAPAECTAEIAGQILRNHLQAPSMLTVMPLQDWLAMDNSLRRPDASAERINVPANPDNYWCYRMHITLEKLLGNSNFNEQIGKIIADSGR